ncbi:MAG: zinc ribbon domain-containing protein [Verrucomicrobia bacterium]|nr:MAG: zinc ribbon domain-containing protein [Verrucomicrobiota bacterium]
MSSDNTFVTCRCHSCAGGIEFERELFDPENPATIECPHCGSETQLYTPNENQVSQNAPAQSTPATHKRVSVGRSPRISLTPKQCETTEGYELMTLLLEITHDGLVNANGVRRLNAWLEGKANSDLPAAKYLSQLPERLGEINTATAFEIHFAIERVLPKRFRADVKQRRQEAWMHSPLKPKATEAQLDYIRGLGGTPPPGINIAEASQMISELLGESDSLPSEKATQSQIQYIRDLGGTVPVGMTKLYASMLIEKLLRSGEGQPTPRQIMVLRFWNRLDLAEKSKGEIEQWLDQFYRQDGRRKGAWALYKYRNKDDGTQRDPSWVAIGEGEKCLQEIAATRRMVGLIFLGVVGVVVIVVVLISKLIK